MSDGGDRAARLRSALDRLARLDEKWIASPEGKTSREIETDDPLAALFEEIGETVLPARVVFGGRDSHIALAVSGRRVQGLLGASETVLEGRDTLIGVILSPEDAGSLATVGEIVRAVTAGPGPMTLRSEIAPRLGGEAEPGVTPDQLRAVWGESSAPPSPLEAFLGAAQTDIRGGILASDGEISKSFGDKNLSEPLIDVLNAAWPDFDSDRRRIAPDHADPSLTCWQQSGGPVVAVAVWPEYGLAALAFLPDRFPQILSHWNKVLMQ